MFNYPATTTETFTFTLSPDVPGILESPTTISKFGTEINTYDFIVVNILKTTEKFPPLGTESDIFTLSRLINDYYNRLSNYIDPTQRLVYANYWANRIINFLTTIGIVRSNSKFKIEYTTNKNGKEVLKIEPEIVLRYFKESESSIQDYQQNRRKYSPSVIETTKPNIWTVYFPQ